MENSEKCKSGYWACRFEVFGVILIIIATCLTIVTHKALGIVMLFLVGLALCFHKCFSGVRCHWHGSKHTFCLDDKESDMEEPKVHKTTKANK